MSSTAPVRIQRKRSKNFRLQGASPNGLTVVYVGRPSRWGNPFAWQAFGHDAAADLFARWLVDDLTPAGLWETGIDRPSKARSDGMRARILVTLSYLRGKNLACWCRLCNAHADGLPLGIACVECEPCHADVLLELANQELSRSNGAGYESDQ